MCGITGYVDFSSRIREHTLRLMTDQITHRGPDSSGIYSSRKKKAFLGVRRLSIIDLKTGDQPIKNEDGSVVVVYNGEIYNYLELRNKLIKSGHKLTTKSDTEVLVHLFEEYGEKMPKHLNGMFAFAIWDENKQSLFLARDGAGIKPLYYYVNADRLIFGSEVKSILVHPSYKKSIDKDVVELYKYFGYIPGAKSIFKGIFKLSPGHSLTFSRSGFKINKFFEPRTDIDVEGIELEDLLQKTVVQQTVSDVPWGVFLSGGLDSSLVAYFLAKKKHKIKTFSISFEEKSFDESRYASVVAKRLGTKHYSEYFNASDVISSYDEICGKLDEPLADPSFFPTYKVSKLARKHVKVVLSGDGGDELFGGYPTYQGHLVADKFNFLPNVLLNSSLHLLNFLPNSYENFAKKDIMTSFIKGLGKVPIERHLSWMSMFNLGQKSLYKRPKIAQIKNTLSTHKNIKDTVRRMQMLDFYTYLRDDLLFKVDRASMYNSLEVRVPFLGKAVVDYAFSTKKTHVNIFKTKILLREILKDTLPEVARRKKKGFGIPIAKWINSELTDFVDAALNNQKLNSFFDKKEISQLWGDHRKKKQNNARIIWMAVMFSGWLDNWS